MAKDKKEYNSLLSAIWFTFIDCFFAYSTNSKNEDSLSMFDLSQRLGKKGKALQERFGLIGCLFLLIFGLLVSITLLISVGPIYWVLIILFGSFILGVIIGYLTIQQRKATQKKKKKRFWFINSNK